MQKLLQIFDSFNEMIDTSPPVDQPQRFGNKSYRAWWRKMNHVCCHIFINMVYYFCNLCLVL